MTYWISGRMAGAVLGMAAATVAAPAEWVTAREDGVRVEYRVSDLESGGLRRHRVEFAAVDTSEASLEACVAALRDVSNHGDILEEKTTRALATLSDTSWLVYYFFDSPWPMKDADCVAVMTMARDAAQGHATFTVRATPDRHPSRGVDRFDRYATTYRFQDLGKGKVEIRVTADIVPTQTVPLFLLRAAFPSTAVKMVLAVERLARVQVAAGEGRP